MSIIKYIINKMIWPLKGQLILYVIFNNTTAIRYGLAPKGPVLLGPDGYVTGF